MNSVRSVVSVAREEVRGIGAGRRIKGVDLHRLIPLVSLLVVFGCFFLIGRASVGGSARSGELPIAIKTAFANVGISPALSSVPPIQTNAVLESVAAASRAAASRPVEPPRPTPTTVKKSSEPARPVTAELPATVAPRPAPAPAPAPAPTVEHRASPQPTTTRQARPAKPSNGGQGSFDSSG